MRETKSSEGLSLKPKPKHSRLMYEKLSSFSQSEDVDLDSDLDRNNSDNLIFDVGRFMVPDESKKVFTACIIYNS